MKIADKGKGIASGAMPFIFDMTRQADSETTRQHGGMGIGTGSRHCRIGCGRDVHCRARPACTTCTRSACIRRLARTSRYLLHQQPNWAAVSIRTVPDAMPWWDPVAHRGHRAPIRQTRSTPGSRWPGNCLAGSTMTITLTGKSAPPPLANR